MRLRRLSTVFWGTCIVVCVFILYMLTDLSFKLPSVRPAVQEPDESKWSSFESKLKHIESELDQHHAVVGEIKSVVEKIVENSNTQKKNQTPKLNLLLKEKEFKVVGEEPPRMSIEKFNESSCPIQKLVTPNVDIQMLTMYERIKFDDKDGGVWKQGWKIEYNEGQWNRNNKLKVFIVPHSHNDPGWIKTFENYYKTQTKAIFKNMVDKLGERQGRKFIWAEISYLALWWKNDASAKDKAIFENLLKSGQIEIVTGGWVMNDEASAHWLSIIQQLATGHQWLIDKFGYIPKNSWSIDPFGYSSAQPYLLKLAGFDNSVIQRVHYRIKKELALNRHLEFNWRQTWDGNGKTDMFTHMMPFYSYDIPHSCGPDPKICCQFDFKRLPGNGISCPWLTPPRKITEKNVAERAYAILDQWRKKAQLYRSSVVMYPLGDDFRYDQANEWDNQYQNYETLIDYINANDALNAEVQFGTLADYFKALHAELSQKDFPTLSGDFFTYADRNQHYWSGYFTSRPFYKNMDRSLLAYVRAAELLTSTAISTGAVSNLLSIQLLDRVEAARRVLSLFQHHDAVAGTSRDEVREDYAMKMHKAIKYSQSAIQQSLYFIVGQPQLTEQTQDDVFMDVDDVWVQHDEIPTRITIALDILSPQRRVLLYNPLMFKRTELVTVIVSTPYVEVFDPEGRVIMCQVSPVVMGEKYLGFTGNKYQVTFVSTVEAMGQSIYTISLRDSSALSKHTFYSKVRIYNADYWIVDLPKVFEIDNSVGRLKDVIYLQANGSTRVIASANGLLKAIVSKDGTITPVHMDFVQYDTDKTRDNNSGAYLFIPDGPATKFQTAAFPEMVAMEGPIKASLYTACSGQKAGELTLAISVYNNPTLPQTEVELVNTLNIDPHVDNLELSMRLSTAVKNENTFFTDLNGMQMIKRKYFEKLPLQANFYPLSAATYIEDEDHRITLLTSTPLGMAALQPGQIEIMQDRRLSKDDNRGMNQGVLDNVRTRHTFKLIVEKAINPCKTKTSPDHPSGQLSLGVHVSQQMLLQPLSILHYSSRDEPLRPSSVQRPSFSQADLVLASYRTTLSAKAKDGTAISGSGMTFQRVYLEKCYGDQSITKWYPLGDGMIKPMEIAQIHNNKSHVYESSLTFVQVTNRLPGDILTLCPMEIRSVFIT